MNKPMLLNGATIIGSKGVIFSVEERQGLKLWGLGYTFKYDGREQMENFS